MVLLKKLLYLQRSIPLLLVFVLISTLSAAILRFYNLENTVQFLGDQGRDALIVSQIFTKQDFVAIGPTTSVGNMYLGPLYYYWMLPFLWLSYPSPIGPVYAIALLGTLTVFCTYFWGRRLVGEQAAAFAAFLCAFSVLAINLSRFSWNPNPTPFVMLLQVYLTYLAVVKNPKYWLGVAAAFAILLQLHYVTLLAGAAAGSIWVWQVCIKLYAKQPIRSLLLSALGGVVLVLFSLSPLLLFDIKHGGLNTQALTKMFVASENFGTADTQLSPISQAVKETRGKAMRILFEFQIGNDQKRNAALVVVLVVALVITLIRRKREPQSTGVGILVTYLLVGIVGFSLYKNAIFDHYIAFLIPCSFLLIGFYLHKVWQWQNIGKLIVGAALLFFLDYNVRLYNFQPMSTTFKQLGIVTTSIQQRVQPGQKYGIVLISGTKDYHGMNYRYFLSTNQEKEPLSHADHGWAERLFIIDEEKKNKTPEEIDIFEINSFNNPVVIERFSIPGGPNITVLENQKVTE